MPDYQLTAEGLEQIKNEMFNKYFLDNTQLIDTLKHTLKGEELVEQERDYVGADGQKQTVLVNIWRTPTNEDFKPPINEKGYQATMQKIIPLLDKVVSGGNISMEEANQLVRENANSLTCQYIVNFNNYGLTKTSINMLIDTIITILKFKFTGSVDMELMKQFVSTYQINEIKNIQKDITKQPGISL